MKTKLIILLSVSLALFVQCKKDNTDDQASYPYQLRFLTEEYKPFNYSDNGQHTGLATAILNSL